MQLFTRPAASLDPVLTRRWLVVCLSADVTADRPRPATVLGVDLVIWRAADGRVLAWEDLCIHRGARLSAGCIDRGELVCPYHAWHFDDSGRCTRIPAHPELPPPERARANTFHAAEAYGLVWVCLDQPDAPIPPLKFWDDPRFSNHVFAGPYTMRASAPRVIENFTDVSHLGIVHPGLLGHPGHPEILNYEVSLQADGVHAPNIILNFPLPADGGKISQVPFSYSIPHPLTAHLHVAREDIPYAVWTSLTPVRTDLTIAWIWILTSPEAPAELLRQTEDLIISQDVAVVEGQRPELLPLDLQAELHLRSDRVSIAYRQWLRQLGLTFGTA